MKKLCIFVMKVSSVKYIMPHVSTVCYVHIQDRAKTLINTCLFNLFLLLVLVIDPENKTCVEFQIVIKEKLEQGRSNRINLWV